MQEKKQRQRHGDTDITFIFFTIVKHIGIQWSLSLFHHEAQKKKLLQMRTLFQIGIMDSSTTVKHDHL